MDARAFAAGKAMWEESTCSKTVTSCPSLLSSLAATRPAAPAPMTACKGQRGCHNYSTRAPPSNYAPRMHHTERAREARKVLIMMGQL